MKRRFTTESGYVYNYGNEHHLPPCPLQNPRPPADERLPDDTVRSTFMQDVNTVLDAALTAKRLLITRIGMLPDNQKIRRYDDKCFAIMFSDLENTWTPCYYDFKLQYRLLQSLVRVTPLEQIIPVLDNVISTGILPRKIFCHDRGFKFHPDVITNLKALIT